MPLAAMAVTLQQIADALAAVLQVQVDIVDGDLTRIAKAGAAPDRVGVEPRSGQSYRYVLAHGEPLFIDEPRSHGVCLRCKERDACRATAEIVWPIRRGPAVVGCIGLVAVNERERHRLLDQVEGLTRFTERISDLITAKVSEMENSRALASLASKLENILHSVSDGIMAIQADRRIISINPAACRILGVTDPSVLDGSIFGKTIQGDQVVRCLDLQEDLEDEPVDFTIRGTTLHCAGTVKAIKSPDGYGGVVCVFRTLEAVDRLAVRVHGKDTIYTFDDILGRSPQLAAAKERAMKVARSNATVLLLGDTGTGKEIFARAIHSASPRAGKPFVPVNSGGIPDTLLESELFGYAEGAFTGARKGGKPGKFELAAGGTLFLDEIGDMPLHMQVKLLRVLEHRVLERLGGTQPVPVDVRIIAATNRDLLDLAQRGKFRSDLYYRLNVMPVKIPSLRERPEDIEFLANHFLRVYTALYHREIRSISPETMSILRSYQWPGNVRELQNTVEYAVNVEGSHSILPGSLTSDVLHGSAIDPPSAVKSISDVEAESIRQALETFGYHTEGKRMAARALGIHLSTLYRRLKHLDLEKP